MHTKYNPFHSKLWISDQSMLQPVSMIDASVKDMFVINFVHMPTVKEHD